MNSNLPQPAPFISVIVNNYNYGRFLREAIDSALAQTWPHREIIVVDDGSTDGSQEIVRSYGDRIIPILKENGGQASAFNAGWRICKGDLILFLDADDKLFDHCLEVVAQKWNPACVKAHYRLEIRDAQGDYRGAYPPLNSPLAQGDVLDKVWFSGFYMGTPCSGNFYSRAVLEKLLPMSEPGFRLGADTNLNIRVPFYGPILAIDQVLGVYRMHGNNAWFAATITDDVSRMRYRLELTASYRRLFIEEARRNGRTDPVPDWPMDTTIQRFAMFCRKMDPAHEPPGSPGVARLGWQLLAYTWPQKEISWKEKLSHFVYVIVITCSPVWFINRLRKALPTIKRLTRKRAAIIAPTR